MSAAKWAVAARSIGTLRDLCLTEMWFPTFLAALAAPPSGNVSRACLHGVWHDAPIRLMVPLVR